MSVRIGTRELRQNLTTVLKRVQNGERLIVTSHNRPVAELGPVGAKGRTLAQLIAAGEATAAEHGPPHRFKPVKLDLGADNALSEALEELRDEDR